MSLYINRVSTNASLIAAKASNPNQASGGDSSNSSSCSNSNGGSPSGPSISKEVGSVAGSVSQDRIVPKVEPGVPGVVNGIKRIPSTGGSAGVVTHQNYFSSKKLVFLHRSTFIRFQLETTVLDPILQKKG